jgi:hypothetical protein
VKSHISKRQYDNFPERRHSVVPSIGERLRRFIDDLGRSEKRLPSVSVTVISILMILFTAFIAGGGIYDLLDNPLSIIPLGGGRYSMVHYLAGEQTINESVVSMVLTLFMVGGLVVSYRSTKVTNDRRKANTMLIIGIALILMGLAGSHYLLILRRTVGQ